MKSAITGLLLSLLSPQIYLPVVQQGCSPCPCACPVATTTTTATTTTAGATTTTLPYESLQWFGSEPNSIILDGMPKTISITGRGFAVNKNVKVLVDQSIGVFPLQATSNTTGFFTIPGNNLNLDYWGGKPPEFILAFLTCEISDSDFYFFLIERKP